MLPEDSPHSLVALALQCVSDDVTFRPISGDVVDWLSDLYETSPDDTIPPPILPIFEDDFPILSPSFCIETSPIFVESEDPGSCESNSSSEPQTPILLCRNLQCVCAGILQDEHEHSEGEDLEGEVEVEVEVIESGIEGSQSQGQGQEEGEAVAGGRREGGGRFLMFAQDSISLLSAMAVVEEGEEGGEVGVGGEGDVAETIEAEMVVAAVMEGEIEEATATEIVVVEVIDAVTQGWSGDGDEGDSVLATETLDPLIPDLDVVEGRGDTGRFLMFAQDSISLVKTMEEGEEGGVGVGGEVVEEVVDVGLGEEGGGRGGAERFLMFAQDSISLVRAMGEGEGVTGESGEVSGGGEGGGGEGAGGGVEGEREGETEGEVEKNEVDGGESKDESIIIFSNVYKYQSRLDVRSPQSPLGEEEISTLTKKSNPHPHVESAPKVPSRFTKDKVTELVSQKSSSSDKDKLDTEVYYLGILFKKNSTGKNIRICICI